MVLQSLVVALIHDPSMRGMVARKGKFSSV
jgi:hypothetical protein